MHLMCKLYDVIISETADMPHIRDIIEYLAFCDFMSSYIDVIGFFL